METPGKAAGIVDFKIDDQSNDWGGQRSILKGDTNRIVKAGSVPPEAV